MLRTKKELLEDLLKTFSIQSIGLYIADGCNCNRETWKQIEKAGFSSCEIHHTIMKGTMALHAPHIIGYSKK